MTVTIAVSGKSGSGKTTFVKALLSALHEKYSNKSILLVDNDLSEDLANNFGIKVTNTIHSLKTGTYTSSTPMPEKMEKHQFIDWAITDLAVNLYEEIDIIVSGPLATKSCSCITDQYIDDALFDLIKSYDIAIFDCEYDLEYLHNLVDYHIDANLIISDTTVTSLYSAIKITDSSKRYALNGQTGIIVNKIKEGKIPDNIAAIMIENDVKMLGIMPYDEELEYENITGKSEAITQAVKELLYRLNLSILGD